MPTYTISYIVSTVKDYILIRLQQRLTYCVFNLPTCYIIYKVEDNIHNKLYYFYSRDKHTSLYYLYRKD